ncbi:hypothetical protein GIB67_034561 [Kingdonia uniflora]|uniref:Uncharacterized protein n=1 Tax=Kingdonia uniflora TaxID=39325 RepID=A0A7J7MXC2_9MAGN|nr:hypothetical protein GIB67_034561 [Kingdonia uniflora]
MSSGSSSSKKNKLRTLGKERYCSIGDRVDGDDGRGETICYGEEEIDSSSPRDEYDDDTIWEKGELPQEEFEDEASSEQTAPPPFPRKFQFGVKVPKPLEKSEYEKEMDFLWAQMEFGMKSNETGSFMSVVNSEDNNKDVSEAELKADPSSLCRKGAHRFVFNKEIGLKCSICSFVSPEIKYILPPWVMDQSERSSKNRYAHEEDSSTLDGFMFQDIGCSSQGSHIHFKGTVWERFLYIKKSLYVHQQEGFEFLWNNIAGGIELDKSKRFASPHGVGGCDFLFPWKKEDLVDFCLSQNLHGSFQGDLAGHYGI